AGGLAPPPVGVSAAAPEVLLATRSFALRALGTWDWCGGAKMHRGARPQWQADGSLEDDCKRWAEEPRECVSEDGGVDDISRGVSVIWRAPVVEAAAAGDLGPQPTVHVVREAKALERFAAQHAWSFGVAGAETEEVGSQPALPSSGWCGAVASRPPGVRSVAAAPC
ncbi:unnamed protein product, partial [Prorocentrum cordatum]